MKKFFFIIILFLSYSTCVNANENFDDYKLDQEIAKIIYEEFSSEYFLLRNPDEVLSFVFGTEYYESLENISYSKINNNLDLYTNLIGNSTDDFIGWYMYLVDTNEKFIVSYMQDEYYYSESLSEVNLVNEDLKIKLFENDFKLLSLVTQKYPEEGNEYIMVNNNLVILFGAYQKKNKNYRYIFTTFIKPLMEVPPLFLLNEEITDEVLNKLELL